MGSRGHTDGVGVMLREFPVEVTVTDVTCATNSASDVGYDEDGESQALKAPAGEQLCLLTMSFPEDHNARTWQCVSSVLTCLTMQCDLHPTWSGHGQREPSR